VIKRIALLAFPGLTFLDLIGVYDSLRRIAPMGIDPEVSVRVIGTKASIEDESGTTLVPDAVYEPLRPYDLLFVPGGAGTRRLMRDAQLLDYLKTWDKGRPVASVCTGSLLLGAAGFLKGKRATTHHLALEELAPFCREVVRDQRIVEDGLVTTAGGVSSSLDLGLHLVERWWNAEARERIAAVMEYRAYSAD
jgi:cyclohexyl-isocyanide hydratase